ERRQAAESREIARDGHVPSASANGSRADAGLLVDVFDRYRPGAHGHLRFSAARSKNLSAPVCRLRRDKGTAALGRPECARRDGELLSGLGVPDLSGRVGKPFYFTSELDFHRGGSSNEFSIDVVQLEDNKGAIDTHIQGPPNKLFGNPPYISIPMRITVADDRNSITIEESGQKIALRAGEWSGWTEFVFPFNPLIKLHGVSRFHLISSQPEVRL